MAQKRFDASIIHTHTFEMSGLPTALRRPRAHRGCDPRGRAQRARGTEQARPS
jgi:hypothetical protein